jgi:hypothetical protein
MTYFERKRINEQLYNEYYKCDICNRHLSETHSSKCNLVLMYEIKK